MSHSPLDAHGCDAVWRAAGAADTHARAQPGARLGRLIGEQRGLYSAACDDGIVPAATAPQLRRALGQGSAARPAVGDFVLLDDDEPGRRRIAAVLPRRTVIQRKEAGRVSREQVVAANVDTALVVCALGGELNMRRIERLITIVHSGGAAPVVAINKADLVAPDVAAAAQAALARTGVPTVLLSLHAAAPLEPLAPHLIAGRTLALLGSSGVGKTTLLNRLLGADTHATGGLSAGGQGRHTTRARQLVVTAAGLLVIDTPGMREIGVWAADSGLAETFSDVLAAADGCRFADCQHRCEPGCAVIAAAAAGQIEPERLAAWQRLRAEAAGRGDGRRGRSRYPRTP